MTETPIPMNREKYLHTSRELLIADVDFQANYTTALHRLGVDEVHQRDPNELRAIMCMDEGLQPLRKSTVRLAGPVPLLARTLPILKQKVSEGVMYGEVFDHDSCGALGLNMAALGEDMDINPNKAGEVLARRFAKDLTQEYDEHTVSYGGRLPLLRRPTDKHTGQTVYYDARDSGIDLAHLEEFDPGYTISRGLFGFDAAREYSSLALGMAFGSTGLSGELTPNTPLHLVGVAENHGEIGKINDELNALRRSRGQDAERIKVSVISAH